MAGVVAKVGESVNNEKMEELMGIIDYHGPDGRNYYSDSTVYIGHHHFYTTPEEIGEDQPVTIGDFVVAFDGRIDNRDELISKLGINKEISDAELFLQLYIEFGEKSFEKIAGAFAVVLYNISEREIILGRDKTGIRTLYYSFINSELIVATEIEPLLEGIDSISINTNFVYKYIVEMDCDQENTFYNEVKRIPPAGYLKLDGSGNLICERYWEPFGDIKFHEEKEAARELEKTLKMAIDDRMRSPQTIATEMSGGLDSTAVASIAGSKSETPLQTYSLISHLFGTTALTYDEQNRISEMDSYANITNKKFLMDNSMPLDDMSIYEDVIFTAPTIHPTMPANLKIMKAAGDDGYGILLDGRGGDLYVGNRFYYSDLLHEGKIFKLWNDMRSDPYPTHLIALWYLLTPKIPKFAQIVSRITSQNKFIEGPDWLNNSFVNVARKDEDSLNFPQYEVENSSYKSRYWSFYHGFQSFSRDMTNKYSIMNGVQRRSPYFDSRYMKLMFSLHPRLLYKQGTHKYIHRIAMENHLPEDVLTQSGSDFSGLVVASVTHYQDEIENILTNSILSKLDIVEEDRLIKSISILGNPRTKSTSVHDIMNINMLWKAVALEFWLQQMRSKSANFSGGEL